MLVEFVYACFMMICLYTSQVKNKNISVGEVLLRLIFKKENIFKLFTYFCHEVTHGSSMRPCFPSELTVGSVQTIYCL